MMPWHADYPLSNKHPFPIRSLWMVSNPNPESGLTAWLNIEDGMSRLSDELFDQIDNIKIIHQSWYDQTKAPEPFSFVKTHAITGNHSLRLNYFNDKSENITDAWIKSATFNGEIREPGDILKPYYRELASHPDLVYTHKWDNFDIAIYDNWSFVHNRTRLVFDPTLERKFYRVNIKHLNDKEWESHSINIANKYYYGK
jgi:alpha-ketoglutarate-dependent taurine dioxygenase